MRLPSRRERTLLEREVGPGCDGAPMHDVEPLFG